MPKDKKIQIRFNQSGEETIDIAMEIFKTSKKSEAIKKSLKLITVLEKFFQKDGSLKILDEEGKEKNLFFF